MAETRALRQRTFELASKGEINPEEARDALTKAVRELSDADLKGSRVLFASFRGGQLTVIL